jgi:hypothetical protein
MDLGQAVDTHGGWARFLEMVGTRSLRSADDAGLFAHAPVRSGLPRPGRALVRTADAISTWIDQTTDARCRTVLSATALGFELAALRLEVKDLVLATLAGFAPADLVRLAQVRPDCAALGAFGEFLLIEPRFGQGESRPAALPGGEARPWGYDAEWQAKDLFATLVEALGQRALPGRASLERISTAGWLAIASVMAGIVPFEMEPLPTETEPPLRPRLLPLPDPALATPLRARDRVARGGLVATGRRSRSLAVGGGQRARLGRPSRPPSGWRAGPWRRSRGPPAWCWLRTRSRSAVWSFPTGTSSS